MVNTEPQIDKITMSLGGLYEQKQDNKKVGFAREIDKDSESIVKNIADPLNESIQNGEFTLGQATEQLIGHINNAQDLVQATYLVHALLLLENEKPFLHPNTSVLSEKVLEQTQYKNIDELYQIIGTDSELINSAFGQAQLPDALKGRKDLDIPQTVSENILTRQPVIQKMIDKLLSETLIRIDDLHLNAGFIDKDMAIDLVKLLNSPNGSKVYSAFIMLAAHSLCVGSQTTLSQRLVNNVNDFDWTKDIRDVVASKKWEELVDKIYYVTSGPGRTKFWVDNSLLENAISASDKDGVDVIHLGGGIVEPVEIGERIENLGGKTDRIVNLDMHTLEKFDSMAAYTRFEANGHQDTHKTGVDADTKKRYAEKVNHMLFDLRSDESILPEVGKGDFDLALSLHVIKPHLLSGDRLTRTADMLYLAKENGGIVVIGGWFFGDPVGCNEVVLKMTKGMPEVWQVRMSSPRNSSEGFGTSMKLFEGPDFKDLSDWSPPRRGDDLKNNSLEQSSSLLQ